MNISIAGQHLTLNPDLQEHVKKRMNEVVSRYFEHATSSNVHFTKDGRHFLCDMVVHEGSGAHILIKAEATSDEIQASFDAALTKAEQRLRKYKEKLKHRHGGVKVSELSGMTATKYTIDSTTYNTLDDKAPVIIAEREVEVPKITVSEAVMRMELENLPALMFQNSKTGRMNVVYPRHDGNIAWVESRTQV
jgi:ribosomal subunit interface protein